ncbi:carboxypeptidase-like regulatory domain-containing protein [Nucisporomicrobium flavum]|uniref:carboxypeptidase-like regulatory domain-containing protein n=1 Tax=Nucisporomicrobium flavum TaxID=2785915 RepID=UPI0018F5B52A|nr:carboxypeptidase-like regulatory domain-containing protein [Nucisporomicrobium flavum]
MVQAGAFLALVCGIIAAAPTVASAAPPTVTINSLSSGDIPSGGKTTLSYTITNRVPPTPEAAETVTVVINAPGMSCDRCNFDDTIPPGQSKKYTATLTAGNVEAGQTRTVNVQISATIGEAPGGGTGSAGRAITVRGADKPKTVREVSGRVRDQDGNPVAGAAVGLQDSAGRAHNTTSGNDGRYSISGSESDPIAVGRIVVGATKQGYNTTTATVQGSADKSINVPLTIKLLAAPTSATPSVSATPSATPTEDVTDEATEAATEEDTAAAALDQKKTSGEDDGNGSLLFIILGGLLVAAGIGAIVLVLMRRKNGDPDDPDGVGPGGVVPPSRGFGAADETRVGAPMGGRASDATMIAPRSGAPSIADAPTMIHHVPAADPVDEFPDPYGAPLPQNGAYNAPGGYGATAAAGAAGAAGTYGAATQYGGAPVPAQSGGYGDDDGYGGGYDDPNGYGGQGGYTPNGGPQRYDEPTGMYRPDPNGFEEPAGYGEPGYDNGYGQGGGDYAGGGRPGPDDYAGPGRGGAYQAGGYQGGGYGQGGDDQGGYGSWDDAGGMDSGNAYGPPAGGGAYGAGTGTYGAGGAAGGGAYGGGAPGGAYGGGAYGNDQDAGYDEDYDQRGGGTYGGGGAAYGGGGAQPGGGTYGGTYGGGAAGGAAGAGGTYGGEQGRRGAPRQQPDGPQQPGPRRPIDWMDD